MTTPRVSVLIPTYRYARYLAEAVDSILAQDSGDFELLISDDCSNDGTREIMGAFAARDPRIRIHIHPVNIGMVQNWNWCLSQARGEFVKYVFGDDRLARPDALGKMAAMLEANPGASLAACAREMIDETSKVTGRMDTFGVSGVHGSAETMARCLADGNIIGEPSAVMFRRAAAVRGFSEEYGQLVDLEMWLHLLEHGPLVYTPDPLCAFRRHPLQQTESNRKKLIDKNEYLRLMLDYGRSPLLAGYDVRKIEFRRLYESRRFLHDEAVAAVRPQLMQRHGRLSYCARWLLRKLTNPFSALAKRAAAGTQPGRHAR
jgi:glycosyltransferase involved in cell wall biosynthesis